MYEIISNSGNVIRTVNPNRDLVLSDRVAMPSTLGGRQAAAWIARVVFGIKHFRVRKVA